MPYYRENDILFAYEDYQQELNPIGIAKLLTFKSTGLPFALNDDGSGLFNIEEWDVEWLDQSSYLRNSHKFRYPIQTASSNELELPPEKYTLQDKFFETDGIEWF